jgi:hypothetical protein
MHFNDKIKFFKNEHEFSFMPDENFIVCLKNDFVDNRKCKINFQTNKKQSIKKIDDLNLKKEALNNKRLEIDMCVKNNILNNKFNLTDYEKAEMKRKLENGEFLIIKKFADNLNLKELNKMRLFARS